MPIDPRSQQAIMPHRLKVTVNRKLSDLVRTSIASRIVGNCDLCAYRGEHTIYLSGSTHFLFDLGKLIGRKNLDGDGRPYFRPSIQSVNHEMNRLLGPRAAIKFRRKA
jgi:hypothetical protein